MQNSEIISEINRIKDNIIENGLSACGYGGAMYLQKPVDMLTRLADRLSEEGKK